MPSLHPISDGSGAGLASSNSGAAAIPARAFSGSSLYRWHQSVLRGPDDSDLVCLAKFEAVVQGYQQHSGAVAASVSDHLKMSNRNTAKCFSAVETLATRYAVVASRIDAWDQWNAPPAEPNRMILLPPPASPTVPDPEPAAPTAPMGAPSGSSGFLLYRSQLSGSSGCGSGLPFSVHPCHDCIYHQNACPDSGRPEGGGDTTNTSITRNLLRGQEPPKSRRNLLSPCGRRHPRARNTPESLRPRGLVQRRTPLRWGTSIPSQNMFSLFLGNLLMRHPTLRTRVQFLQ